MPEIPAYLDEFGLYEGLQIAGYTLEKIQISHKELSRFREYSYPTTLIWRKSSSDQSSNQSSNQSSSNQSAFQSALQNQLNVSRVVYTKYGNPYDCLFGTLSFQDQGDHIVVTATGDCKRNFELPKH